MLYEEFDHLTETLTGAIKDYYKTRLVSLVLFGSCSRRTQHFNSDVDLLIILTESSRGKISRMNELMEHLDSHLEEDFKKLTRNNIHTEISPVIKTKKEIEQGHLLLYEMTESCKILFDPTLFMTHFLTELKDKMKKAGVKKTSKGYWIVNKELAHECVKGMLLCQGINVPKFQNPCVETGNYLFMETTIAKYVLQIAESVI
jgi:predicted nucleotidyltransferase